jgi:hypothetical protein
MRNVRFRWQGIERDLHLSTNEVREHGPAIRHVHHVHPCHLEQLTRNMGRLGSLLFLDKSD